MSFEKRPCSSSTSESIPPAQSRQRLLQRAAGKGEILTETRYIDEPITIAVTEDFAICRSTTEPLRT